MMGGDGGVGVDDVEEVVDEVGVALGDELHVVDGDVAACGRGAKLAQGFEEGSAVAGDVTGDAAGKMAAEDAVAAEGPDSLNWCVFLCGFFWMCRSTSRSLRMPLAPQTFIQPRQERSGPVGPHGGP